MGVRAREPHDMAACVDLLRQTHESLDYPTFWPSDPAGWIADDQEVEAWVFEDERGVVVGHVSRQVASGDPVAPLWCEATQQSLDQLAVISRLFVGPPSLNQGVGSALLERAVEGSHALGLTPVLDVLAHHSSIVDFYAKRGWRLVGEANDYWNDEPIPVVAMVGPTPN